MRRTAVETKKRKKLGEKERSKSPMEVVDQDDEDHQLRERVRLVIKGVQKGLPIVGISED